MARRVDHAYRADLAVRALEFIRDEGMRRVSMSELATALGMSRPALYWYFKSLGDVFEAVLNVIIERQRVFLKQRMAEPAAPLDVVEAWLRGTCAFYAEDPQLLTVLIQLWAMGDPSQPERVLAGTRAHALDLQEASVWLLTDAIEAGQVADCDLEALIGLCAGTLDGLLVQQVLHGTDPVPALDLFCRRVLDPLRMPETGSPS